MTAVALMAQGRKDIKETDASLARAERVVADTIAVGTATAAPLADQVHTGRRCYHVHTFFSAVRVTQTHLHQALHLACDSSRIYTAGKLACACLARGIHHGGDTFAYARMQPGIRYT